MSPTRIELRQFGDFLGTRLLGKDARELVLNALAQDADVVVDFAGISGVSVSFADEFAGKLVDQVGLDKFRSRIKFRNADDGIASIVRFALNGRLRMPL